MLAEALVLANPHIHVPGRDDEGRMVARRMSECPRDYHAYWRLGEYLVRNIENSMLPVSEDGTRREGRERLSVKKEREGGGRGGGGMEGEGEKGTDVGWIHALDVQLSVPDFALQEQ